MFTQITIRLTQRQAEILYPALRLIAINWECLSKTGRSPGAHPDVMNLGFLKRRGVFNREFLESALAIWKMLLRKRGSECRLKVNYIGIAACLLAVRVTLQRLRHRHLQPWADHLDLTANRLVRKLEAVQKKLKRQIVASHDQPFFQELSHDWRQFVRWARSSLLTCACTVKWPNFFYRSQQLLISEMCRITKAELRKQKFEIPPDRIFRKLVRDGLKNVRRYRSPFTLPTIRRNPQIADWWFAEYVIRRLST